MANAFHDMVNWIKLSNPSIIYILIFLLSLAYLLIVRTEVKKSFIIPSFIILVLLVNPVLYKLVYSRFYYWRMLWSLADAIIIAFAITEIIRRHNKIWVKLTVCVAFLALIVLTGVNIITSGEFIRLQNKEKVAKSTMDVCDCILEVDESPYCVFPVVIAYEARQYNGNIYMMYGRNSEGFINELKDEYMKVRNELDLSPDPDYDYIFSTAKKDLFNFVVCHESKPVEQEVIDRYNYKSIAVLDGYIVYYCEDINN